MVLVVLETFILQTYLSKNLDSLDEVWGPVFEFGTWFAAISAGGYSLAGLVVTFVLSLLISLAYKKSKTI